MDASSTGSSSGLGKLIPKSIKEKRRRRREASHAAEVSVTGSDDIALPGRGRSLLRRPTTTESDGTGNTDRTDDVMADADGSSQFSYESDQELSLTRPTAISTHPSQIGYLTTSSPLVQAAHNPESQPSDTPPVARSRGSSILAQVSIDDDRPNLDLSSVHSPEGLEHSEASHLLSRRSPSISRVKDVFRSKKDSIGTAGSSPERRPPSIAVESLALVSPDVEPGVADPQKEDANVESATSPAQKQRFTRGSKPEIRPPRTPPQADSTPVIVNTPPTPPDLDHPITKPPESARKAPNAPPQGLIVQRRGRAGSAALIPSKLSNITAAPLTPTLEIATPTPGNTTTSNFFSSMISAVQNTANTLSSSITSTASGSKNKQAVQQEQTGVKEEDTIEVESWPEAVGLQSMDSKEPAVKTLGMGDLSLSQLGIMDTSNTSPTPAMAKVSESHDTRARSESAPAEAQQAVADNTPEEAHQSRSIYDSLANDDRTPPTGSLYEEKSGLHRSASIRSAIGRRRKRGSSLATGASNASGVGVALGTTIGAAIAAANASLVHPQVPGSTPKLTGFAVATKKRNRDFHSLFKSVPDDDYLIEDYSCALQREILVHGRLYVSEGHLCFSSNIFGWVTTLVMSFDEIVSVEKRSTALVFKNGLEISTLHAKHVFASFASRDTTYDLIVKIWKLGHPSLRSSLNGVRLEETGGDRTEKVDTESISAAGSQSLSGSDVDSEVSDDDVYDEDEENVEGPDVTQTMDTSNQEPQTERAVARKPSGAVAMNGATEKCDDHGATSPGDDFPGPASHAPTDCGDAATHYDKVLGDDVIPAPLGKVYNMLFGPQSVSWMAKFLATDQRCTELQMEDKKGLVEDNRSRTYTYIKPLSGSIGPKQTKCITTEQLESIDLEKAVNVLATTQNPDVPSGNVFSVKTKYCLSWAENNSTRIQVNCTIEWTGKSWLKGPIEKGASDGQVQYCKDLFASLKAAVSSRQRTGMLTHGAPPKAGKKRGRKGKLAPASNPTSDIEVVAKALAKRQDWGLLEPARPLLGPVVDIIRPLLTGNVVYGLLVGLLVAAWFSFGTRHQPARPFGGVGVGGVGGSGGVMSELAYVDYHRRLTMYDEMWRREESDLWDWIEERVGLERLGGVGNGASSAPRPVKKKAAEPRSMEDKLREARMDERELREAIRVTEERLLLLKDVVEREKGEQKDEKEATDAGMSTSASASVGSDAGVER